MSTHVRVRLCGGAGAYSYWQDLDDDPRRPRDLDWATGDEGAFDGAHAWISPSSLVWLSRRTGWGVLDGKGRLPFEEISRVELDFARGAVRGTGTATAQEISEVLPYGWRIPGKRPRKTKGEGRWTLPLERFQMVLFEEERA